MILKDDKGTTFELPKADAEKELFSDPSYAGLEVELKVPLGMLEGKTHAKITPK